jgi:hypothetical protein
LPQPTSQPIQRLSYIVQHVDGGRQRFLELVGTAASDGDVACKKWWECFTSLTEFDQRRVPLDDVLEAAGVTPEAICSAVVSTAIRYEAQANDLVRAAIGPRVVRQLGKSALRIGGKYADIAHKDRALFLQSNSFLPVPKHSIIQVHAHANATSHAAAAASADPSVPSFLEDMEALRGPREKIQRELAEPIDGDVTS